MSENFFVVTRQVVTLFLIMGVGFFLCKAGRLSKQTVSQVSFLQVNIVVPCVIFNSLRIGNDVRILRELGLAALATAMCYLVTIVASTFMYRKKQADTRAVFRFGVVYSNVAFIGFPLVEAVFGKDALVYAAVSLAVFTLFQWTHGVYIMGGRGKLSARAVLLSPGIIALLLGFMFFLIGFDAFDRFAGPVGSAVQFIANMNTPLALTVLGAQMAFSNYRELFASKPLYGACAIRLIAFPALAALTMAPLLFPPFRLPPHVYITMATLCATPVAGLTSGFSERYSRDVSSAAQLITLSTLLSAVTLPLVVACLSAIVR